MDSITISLSLELGPKNIKVNSIQPAGVLTEVDAKLGAIAEPGAIEQVVKRGALDRVANLAFQPNNKRCPSILEIK